MADVSPQAAPSVQSDPQTDQDFNQAFAPEPDRAPAAQAAPEVSQGPVNVLNPSGKLVSIPHEQLTEALNAGYQVATPEHIAHYEKEQKYGSLGQQAIAGLEGAAEGASFGTSTLAERALGVPGEDIQGRKEINPGTNMIGQGAGLMASSLIPGVGEANLLDHAGAAIAAKVGLGAEAVGKAAFEGALKEGMNFAQASAAKAAALAPFSTTAKIGSGAVKAAAENALFQAGDEASKAFSGDPNQTVQTAALDVGLSSVLGGAFGATTSGAGALWRATSGAKTAGILKAITDKAGGVESGAPDIIHDALQTAGLDVAPEVRAALGDDPATRQMFQTLQDSATGSGLKAQESFKKFKTDAADSVIHAFGKTPEDVAALSNLSERDIGDNIKQSLVKSLKEVSDPITESYEKISNKFKATPLDEDIKNQIAEKVGELASNGASSESAEAKLLQRVLKEVPGLENLEHLRNYTSGIGNETSGMAKQELWGVGRSLRNILNDAQDNALTKAVANHSNSLLEKGDLAGGLSHAETFADSVKNGTDLMSEHLRTKQAYRELKDTISDLNDRLHVGAHAGPKTFMSALKDMDGEQVLRRLSPKGKADIIGELQKFPEVLGQVKDFHLNQLLKQSALRAGDGQAVNPKALFTALDKLSPEMRDFITPKGTAPKLDALKTVLDAIPEKIGKSGTPQGLDALWSAVPGSAVGMVAALTGHGVIGSVLTGGLTKLISRDTPDAVRLALLKFLGSSNKMDTAGFKASVDMIQSIIKGDTMVQKAAKNVFNVGSKVLPEAAMPKEAQRKQLDKKLKELDKNPKSLEDVGGKVPHYMPEHGQALTQFAANAVNYLNSLRPSEGKASPLDPARIPTAMEKANFNQALDMANQPLLLLDKVQKGTLTPADIKTVSTVYPDLYNKIVSHINEHMGAAASKDTLIPYQTRIGLSMLLAHPVDSTMTPASIQAAQSINMPSQPQSAMQKGPSASKMQGLNKLPGSYQTADQSRAARQNKV